jgi:hypothetical protein
MARLRAGILSRQVIPCNFVDHGQLYDAVFDPKNEDMACLNAYFCHVYP